MAALKNKKISRKTTTVTIEPTVRHLWLASLGMLVATRRESKAALKRALAKADGVASDARKAVRSAKADLRGNIVGMRSQVQPKVVKFSSDVEARLAPVLDKLGLKQQAKRRGRKPAAKKPAARRTTRKPGRRVARKAAR